MSDYDWGSLDHESDLTGDPVRPIWSLEMSSSFAAVLPARALSLLTEVHMSLSLSRCVVSLSGILFAIVALGIPTDSSGADKSDQRLVKRIAELEAENRALRTIIAGIQEALKSFPKSSVPSAQDFNSLRVVIVPGDWGGSNVADMQKVCASAAGTIWAQLPDDGFAPIIVQRGKASPITLFKRGEGNEYVVHLNTGGRAWAQCAYQFAHEFCHIVCNYRNVDNPQMWFEETLCETASLFALRRMGVEWQTKPPYSNWKSYSKSLAGYANDRIKQLDGEEKSVADFYRAHEADFKKSATNRPLNGYIASKLLPLFEKTPASWQALRYINLGPATENKSLKTYLSGWHNRVPAEHKPFVKSVAAQFEIPLD